MCECITVFLPISFFNLQPNHQINADFLDFVTFNSPLNSELPFLTYCNFMMISTVGDLEKALQSQGLAVEPVPGDGNCLYEAVARQLTRVHTPRTRQEVKNEILDFMQHNPESLVSSLLNM